MRVSLVVALLAGSLFSLANPFTVPRQSLLPQRRLCEGGRLSVTSTPSLSISKKGTRNSTPDADAGRVLEGINPFGLSPAEAEYMASLPLWLGKYGLENSVALAFVDKLSDIAKGKNQLQKFAGSTSQVPSVFQLLYQPGKRTVREGVETVKVDPKTGKRQLVNDALIQALRLERRAFLIQEDLKNVRQGIYPVPSELKLSNIAGPLALPKFFRELADGFNFAQSTYSGEPDYDQDPKQRSTYFQKLAQNLDLPDYYVDFHSVPGGFLSPEHATVIDLVSEVIFSGTFQTARRMVIRPIVEEARRQGRPTGRGLRLLDLGTATGSFLIQVHEALSEIQLHGLDLSPALLQRAKKLLSSHPTLRRRALPDLKCANMESIPYEDASLNFVTVTNCFHELPESAIQSTVAEIARVLENGGTFVHSDVLQMKDDPSIATASQLAFTKKFNEPYVQQWMQEVDLDDICRSSGLQRAEAPRTYAETTVRVYRKIP